MSSHLENDFSVNTKPWAKKGRVRSYRHFLAFLFHFVELALSLRPLYISDGKNHCVLFVFVPTCLAGSSAGCVQGKQYRGNGMTIMNQGEPSWTRAIWLMSTRRVRVKCKINKVELKIADARVLATPSSRFMHHRWDFPGDGARDRSCGDTPQALQQPPLIS